MDYLAEQVRPPAHVLPALQIEFHSPRTVQNKSAAISVSRSPWDAYNKRKQIEEVHSTDFYAIMRAVAQDGYVKTAVSKYVNSIFLRGYKMQSLKKNVISYLQLRLRFMSEVIGENVDTLFQRIAYDLVAYANVYVIKVRFKQPAEVMPKGLRTIKGLPFLKNGKLKARDPIAAYELVHPATMHIFRDPNGNVVRYEQWPLYAKQRPQNKKERREFDPEDIVHIVMDREDGFAYGMPFLNAVIDDIRMLRLMEDHASRLAFRFAFPFTQVKVGEPKPGMQATEEDLIYYRKLVAEAPPDATLVTNEKVSFDVVGAQGSALDLSKYLEHFENRAFTGLQVPAVSMGRGDTANRSTADAMTTEMHDQIKHLQNILARAITDEIYQELLREAGYSIYDDEKNWCDLIFEEIEVESKIKRETHTLGLLQANVITFSEARKELNRQPFTDKEWEDTYLARFLLPQIVVKDSGLTDLDEHAKLKLEHHTQDIKLKKADHDLTRAQIDQTKADTDLIKKTEPDNPQSTEGPHQTTTTTHVQSRGKDGSRTRKKTVQVKKPVGAPRGHFPPGTPGRPAGPTTGVSKGVDNKNRPANQHGKRSGPKRGTELAVSESIASQSVDFLTTVTGFHKAITGVYANLRDAAIEQGILFLNSTDEEPKLAEFLFHLIKEQLIAVSHTYLLPAYREGVAAFNVHGMLQGIIEQGVSSHWLTERKTLDAFNEATMHRLIRDVARPTLRAIKSSTNATALAAKINAIFETQGYRLAFIANTECPQAFWFGYASAAYLAGVELDLVAEEDACEKCLNREGFENSSSSTIRLRRCPTLHPNCDCALEIVDAGQAANDED